jgi:hypothetical protein
MHRWRLLLVGALVLWPGRPHGQVDVETYSMMTTTVLLLKGTQALSQGTGFLYATTKPDGGVDTVFIVTNFHVVTGHAPNTSEPNQGDRVRFVLHTDQNDPKTVLGVEMPLYTKANEPLWIASEDHPNADVVLLPLPPSAYAKAFLYVFSEAHTVGNIKIRPTSQATLLGYPYGFSDTVNHLPVWKTGHVASEPNVDFQGEPQFLVDVSAFPGMSGSPVLATANGTYETETGAMTTGRIVKLLGVFSAMRVVHPQPGGDVSVFNPQGDASSGGSLQLGYVWKAALIAEIARNFDMKTWVGRDMFKDKDVSIGTRLPNSPITPVTPSWDPRVTPARRGLRRPADPPPSASSRTP